MEKEKLARVETWEKKKLGKNGCWEKRKLGKLKFGKLGKGKLSTLKGYRKK